MFAAADHQPDFCTQVDRVVDLAGESLDDVEIESESLRSRERFSGQLEKHPRVLEGDAAPVAAPSVTSAPTPRPTRYRG